MVAMRRRWFAAAAAVLVVCACTIAGAVPSLPTRDAVEQLLTGE